MSQDSVGLVPNDPQTLSPPQTQFPTSPPLPSTASPSRLSHHSHSLSHDSVFSDANGHFDSRSAGSGMMDLEDPLLSSIHQNSLSSSIYPTNPSVPDPTDIRYAELPTGPTSTSTSAAPSLPATGYVTPLIPSEPQYRDHRFTPEEREFVEDNGNSSFSHAEMITMSVLDGIEGAIREAREAMSRGDQILFNARAQSVVTSADLIRGIGSNTAQPPSEPFGYGYSVPPSGYETANDHINSFSPHRTDGAVGQSPAIVTPEPTSPPRQSVNSDLLQQQAQAFHYGLSLLDIADPSRKRTISTATARAVEPERAAKSQKRSPSQDDSSAPRPQPLTLERLPSTSLTISGSQFVPSSLQQNPSFVSYSSNQWYNANMYSATPDNYATEGAGTPSGFGAQPSTSLPIQNRSSFTPYTPSPLAGNFAVRPSRSSSYSSTHPSLSSFGIDFNVKPESSQSSVAFSRPPSPDAFLSESEADFDFEGPTSRRSSHSVHAEAGQRLSRRPTISGDAYNPANLVPSDLKVEMDKVFEAYLQRVCSNLEATDAKGEAIHQTLMPKKMAKMDESPDFRPFKFRIAAFTNAYMEELAQRHLGEDVIPQKKVKAYLWHQQPLISRFNDDGKKSKSKGNHVWHIFARKDRDSGTWAFRPFERKIVGSPPPVAYVGLKWAWQPRVWDPQMSRQSIVVIWTSPALPPWLKWEHDVLVGIPGPEDAADAEISIEASFPNEKREGIRSTFRVQIAPITISEQVMDNPRRASLAGETVDPRRIASDTAMSQSSTSPRSLNNSPPTSFASDPSQTLRVVTEAAQKIAVAQTQALSLASGTAQIERQIVLAKQQQVLITAAEALAPSNVEAHPLTTNALAQAARDVVNEVAKQMMNDRIEQLTESMATFAAPNVPYVAPKALTIKEVAAAFSTSIAEAVYRSDAVSSELEVMMTARTLVHQQGNISKPVPPLPSSMPSDYEAASLPLASNHGVDPPANHVTNVEEASISSHEFAPAILL